MTPPRGERGAKGLRIRVTARRGLLIYAALAGLLALGLVVLFFVGPRWLATPGATEPAAATGASDARKIHARLFFVAEDGEHLAPLDQEVPFGDGTVEQAKRIVEAALAAPPAPYASAIPLGTTLKTLFLTPGGEAYVDLSPEVQKNHSGGTTSEILTVYALVNALTVNLPAITGVQILIDGKEVDTLAGHLDLRRPLAQDERWVAQNKEP
jgi:Sporulation and spore germination